MEQSPTVMMIADDHPRMRKLIRSFCVGTADEIVEVASGEEAVACYARVNPACLLMDIEMPGMDGLCATRAILASHPEARIIIVTSHDTAAFRSCAAEAGATGFLSKDDLSGLAGLLREVQLERPAPDPNAG